MSLAPRLAEARLRLDAAMGHPAAVAEVARRTALEERRRSERVKHSVRLRMIQIEGETRSAMIRKESEQKIAAFRASYAELRRREEQGTLSWLNLRMKWAREDSRRGKGPVPLDLAQRWHDTQLEQSGTIYSQDAPLIPIWSAHADRLLREFQIECTWVPQAGGINAYAFASARRLEVPPITGAGSYGVFLHEVGHVCNPCEPQHRRVAAKDGCGTVCIACELRAWSFAIEAAEPTWTLEMHRRLARSIGTYEVYATSEKKTAICDIASKLGFYRARQDRITAAVEEKH